MEGLKARVYAIPRNLSPRSLTAFTRKPQHKAESMAPLRLVICWSLYTRQRCPYLSSGFAG